MALTLPNHYSLLTIDSSTPGAIAFIDSRVQDLPALLAALDSNIQPYILHPAEPCIPQIDQVLRALKAHTVYLVGHGAPGVLHLGQGKFNSNALHRYATAVSEWSVERIVLCGCNVGKDLSLLHQLHHLTGAGISAATTPLGNGQWTLDASVGSALPSVEITGDYPYTLALPKVSLALGFGNIPLSLSSLDGTNGFRLDGVSGDSSGISVSSAGDINGDGIVDLMIGASNASPNGAFAAGSTYIAFGSANGFAKTLDLANLNSTNGFRVDGSSSDERLGYSVSSAGDINKDGIDDLIVGAYGASPNDKFDAGASYVVFGSKDAFDATLSLANLDGTNGFRIDGAASDERSGYSVSNAGDINNDGIDDLIVGAYGASPNGMFEAGSSYVVFGSTTSFGATFDLSTLDGTNGFRLDGASIFEHSGISVSAAGDINGDNIADLIIGASTASPGGKGAAGSSYVVFGSDSPFNSTFDLSTLTGTNGFRLDGMVAGDNLGVSVDSVGDINGDGIDDLIVGAANADPNSKNRAGTSYVIFGSKSAFGATFDLSTLNGTNGFRINGVAAGDNSGISVSNAGDVNGDGIDDLIIGASAADPSGKSGAGSSYVIFGTDNGFKSVFNLSAIDSVNGFRIDGAIAGDGSGISVSSAGDVNDDGIVDLIIGASAADPDDKSNAGASYVVFGSSAKPETTKTLTEGTSTSLTIYRSNGSIGDVSVTIEVSGLVSSSDYTLSAGGNPITLDANNQFVVTIPDGKNRVNVSIATTNDGFNEADETLSFSIISDAGYETVAGLGTLTIKDDDDQPSLSISDLTVNEADGTATFTVTLDAASGKEVKVNFGTADGTATAGQDYTTKSGTLTFAPGEVEKTFTIDISNDALDEDHEAFTVNLSNPKNASIQTGTATATINDNDAEPTLSISGDIALNEGDGTATVTVSLNAASGRDVTVNYATVGGSAVAGQDFTAKSGTLTFAPGEVEKTVVVNVTDDSMDEEQESFKINFSNPKNAVFAGGDVTTTITDNDPEPNLSISDVKVKENAGQATFTISLDAASGKEITVNYATADGEAIAGSDYTATSGQITIAAGKTKAQVTVDLLDNSVYDLDKTFEVNLSNPTNAVISDGQAIATLIEDESVPAVRIQNVKVQEGDKGTSSAEFEVTLTGESTQPVFVDYGTVNGYAKAGEDFNATTGTLSFAPGESQKTVSVAIRGDEIYEKNEGFKVRLSNAVNGSIARDQAKGLILEDESLPRLKVANVSVREDDKDKTKAVFVLTREGDTDVKAVVQYKTADGSAKAKDDDYAPTSGKVSFRKGQTEKFVNVKVFGDIDVEKNESFRFEVTSATNVDIVSGKASCTIRNDDRKSRSQRVDSIISSGARQAVYSLERSDNLEFYPQSSSPFSNGSTDDSSPYPSSGDAIIGVSQSFSDTPLF